MEHYIEHCAQALLLTRQELNSYIATVLDDDSIVDGRHIPAINEEKCHHVTYTMDTAYKVLKHYCMVCQD